MIRSWIHWKESLPKLASSEDKDNGVTEAEKRSKDGFLWTLVSSPIIAYRNSSKLARILMGVVDVLTLGLTALLSGVYGSLRVLPIMWLLLYPYPTIDSGVNNPVVYTPISVVVWGFLRYGALNLHMAPKAIQMGRAVVSHFKHGSRLEYDWRWGKFDAELASGSGDMDEDMFLKVIEHNSDLKGVANNIIKRKGKLEPVELNTLIGSIKDAINAERIANVEGLGKMLKALEEMGEGGDGRARRDLINAARDVSKGCDVLLAKDAQDSRA